ncbi:MAG TPA: hypothetical protein VGK73_30215 [Polyangiaceae bacterium]
MRAVIAVRRSGGGFGWVLLASSALLGACGGSKAPAGSPASNDSSEEQGVEAQFEREAEPTQKHLVKVEGAFSAYIEAKSPPKLKLEPLGLTVTADLGWDAEVHCFVHKQVVDAGAAANSMLKAAAKTVKFKALAPYFLEHHALDPVLGIRGVYHVEREGTLMAGDFKLMAMPRPEHPVLCWHDAPGYAKSFARVSTEFAKSFQFKSEQPAPTRGELWAITIDGTPVGFSRDTTYALDDGNVRRVSLGARFLPIAPGEMSFDDEAEIVTSDKDGALVSGKFLAIENGESSLEIDVERSKTGYNYVGTIQSKEVKGSFKSKQALKARYAAERKFKELARAGKKAKFEQWEYTPSIDAAQPSKVSYEVTSVDGGLTIVSTLGQRGATLKTNARGVVRQAVMSVGSRKIQIDLVEELGEL